MPTCGALRFPYINAGTRPYKAYGWEYENKSICWHMCAAAYQLRQSWFSVISYLIPAAESISPILSATERRSLGLAVNDLT